MSELSAQQRESVEALCSEIGDLLDTAYETWLAEWEEIDDADLAIAFAVATVAGTTLGNLAANYETPDAVLRGRIDAFVQCLGAVATDALAVALADAPDAAPAVTETLQ